ncbi:protein O-linked-mannose beta-1,2-N-acetylglucosaminyltransferase 1-like [Procambarus clarkii]|uniref:protein O-linked-mannose beta-1,2-N-acetylglucosaminyltransferase 1-like n=1 Tax=Procambarus clarkii TaxID=6728 RepID=UPI001E672F95|nr:protein O-linked-mannose beta-1,2-N-acetylglucosaminyltransferase 1-like [Procambarus clarkii]
MGHRWRHSGVHLLVLQPLTGRVMLKKRFLTFQPAEHLDLASALRDLQPGRVVVLAAVPEWVMFLGQAGESALASLGFRWPQHVASGEAWAGVAILGHGVVAEAATAVQPRQYPANTLHLLTTLPKGTQEGKACEWYLEAELRLQGRFCRRFEGYGDLCSCVAPFSPAVRYKQEQLVMKEQIPVVVVTASNPRHLYRVLRNLFSIPGAAQTEVLVAVDGAHQEALALTEVLGVGVVVHRPEGVGNNRTNANVRFALYSVFRSFPQADKAIVVEDDLLLSPDFLSFFHQAAWLLDNDPTIFCVNAFNSNSLPGIASDTTKMLRSESYPMYGWMVARSYARQVITNWIPEGPGDWDWWLMRAWAQRGRDVVSPEVSRTFHAGNAGAHVDGFEQHLYYSRMLTSQVPHIVLQNLSSIILENYLEEMKREIEAAEMVIPDPSEESFLPEGRPGPFVVFVRSGTRTDEFFGIRLFLMRLGSYFWDTREIFRGVMRLKYQGRLLYVVGCPLSQLFCRYNPKGTFFLAPSKDLITAVSEANNLYEQSLYDVVSRVRQPTQDLQQEADLLNYVTRPRGASSRRSTFTERSTLGTRSTSILPRHEA